MTELPIDELNYDELQTLSQLIDERIRRSGQADEERERNSNFVQLYREGIKPIRKLTQANPVAAQIFYFLLEHMDWGNSVACSSLVLEQVTGKSRSSVTRALRELKKRGFIATSKMGTTSVYHLNAKVVWSSWANGKRYAKLNATIVLAESEQDKSVGGALTRLVELNAPADEES